MTEQDRQQALEQLDNLEIHLGMIRQYLDPIERYVQQARAELQRLPAGVPERSVPRHVSDE